MSEAVTDGAGAVRYTFRLRVSGSALRSLLAEWDRCRWAWNQCVAESKAAFKAREPCAPAGLDRKLTGWRGEHEGLGHGCSVPQQRAIRDFAESRSKALSDIKASLPVARRAGMPGFKREQVSAPTLNYTRRGFRVRDGRLHLAGGIVLGVVWSRPLPSDPSSARVYRDSLGHWYASFVIQVQAVPLPHPEHGKAAQADVGRYQRMMARRRPAKGQPASHGYKKAKKQAARALKKAARQRQHDGRKWAKKLAADFDEIAVEDFKLRFLTRTTMARKASDAARKALMEMGRKHGRTYTRTACGHVSPRDKNSARVMLNRAGLNPAGADRVRHDAP